MKKKTQKILRSFKPIVDSHSRILILGTMPGPEALRKREYYGFSGNHFWKILFQLFKVERPLSYPEKIRLLKQNRIALWDVFHSCERKTAADNDIKYAKPNNIPGLLKKYPNIKTIFIDSKTGFTAFEKYFSGAVKLPVRYLPSPSPAHASLTLAEKINAWSPIRKKLQ